jgi:hypothetical protein
MIEPEIDVLNRLKVWWQAYGRYKALKKEIKQAEREVEIWRARYDGGFV